MSRLRELLSDVVVIDEKGVSHPVLLANYFYSDDPLPHILPWSEESEYQQIFVTTSLQEDMNQIVAQIFWLLDSDEFRLVSIYNNIDQNDAIKKWCFFLKVNNETKRIEGDY